MSLIPIAVVVVAVQVVLLHGATKIDEVKAGSWVALLGLVQVLKGRFLKTGKGIGQLVSKR